ncbi:hypothetical protein [Flavihumibacter profundi]|uniref:hypothetical protein n=1 Tax=Flavihumibacter profundi TaxID=2716883 RepID=UPI001CC3CBB8|nr:hypothetical protein [Flavihumibacter profundi]MBZ5859442.1 hypothetical protein [Flavihumibacter profundi]
MNAEFLKQSKAREAGEFGNCLKSLAIRVNEFREDTQFVVDQIVQKFNKAKEEFGGGLITLDTYCIYLRHVREFMEEHAENLQLIPSLQLDEVKQEIDKYLP